jgi:hypothetical protein
MLHDTKTSNHFLMRSDSIVATVQDLGLPHVSNRPKMLLDLLFPELPFAYHVCSIHPPNIELSKLGHVTARRPLDAMWELGGGHKHSS